MRAMKLRDFEWVLTDTSMSLNNRKSTIEWTSDSTRAGKCHD